MADSTDSVKLRELADAARGAARDLGRQRGVTPPAGYAVACAIDAFTDLASELETLALVAERPAYTMTEDPMTAERVREMHAAMFGGWLGAELMCPFVIDSRLPAADGSGIRVRAQAVSPNAVRVELLGDEGRLLRTITWGQRGR